MDRFHEPLVSGFGFALSVVATAISVHGDLVVFDAGRKGVGGDLGPPAAPGPGGEFAFIHEEHVGFRYPGGAPYPGGRSRRARPGLRADRREPVRRLPRRRGGHGGGSLARACAPRRAVIAETIRVGDLSFALDGADLVDVRWGALDVASRIQVTVRDPDWGTVPSTVRSATVASLAEREGLAIEAMHDPVGFEWRAAVEARETRRAFVHVRRQRPAIVRVSADRCLRAASVARVRGRDVRSHHAARPSAGFVPDADRAPGPRRRLVPADDRSVLARSR